LVIRTTSALYHQLTLRIKGERIPQELGPWFLYYIFHRTDRSSTKLAISYRAQSATDRRLKSANQLRIPTTHLAMHKQEEGQPSSSQRHALPRRGLERSKIRTPFISTLTITPLTSLPPLLPLSPVLPEPGPEYKPELESHACHYYKCEAEGRAREEVEPDNSNVSPTGLIAVCVAIVLLQLFLWFCIGVHWVWCGAYWVWWEVPEGVQRVWERVVGWVRWWESDEGRLPLFVAIFCIFSVIFIYFIPFFLWVLLV
jgi:hypothetical protein